METKANYVLVGVFTLVALLLLAGVVIFSAGSSSGRNTIRYAIEFPGGVYGLSVGNDVRFNGIKVGQVVYMNISRRDPGIVLVEVEVSSDTPVRKDSEASLEIQGITGMTYVMISSGTISSPILGAEHEGELPLIKAGKSKLEHLMAEAPNMIEAASKLMQRGSDILSPDNAHHLNRTLESLARVSEMLAAQSDRLALAIEELNTAGKKLNAVLGDADKLINGGLSTASASAAKAFDSIHLLAESAQPAIKQFSDSGVSDFYRILREISMLVRTVNSGLQRMTDDPSQFIFGSQVPEYKAPR